MTITWRATTTEQAYEALFQRLSQAYAFKKATRDVRDWSSIVSGNSNLPALVQEQTKPDFNGAANIPTILTLAADICLITDASDSKEVPSKKLNEAADALIAAIAPSPSDDYRQTLNGLVYDCKIMDKADYAEATDGDPRSYAVFHIQMTLTGNEGTQDDTGQP